MFQSWPWRIWMWSPSPVRTWWWFMNLNRRWTWPATWRTRPSALTTPLTTALPTRWFTGWFGQQLLVGSLKLLLTSKYSEGNEFFTEWKFVFLKLTGLYCAFVAEVMNRYVLCLIWKVHCQTSSGDHFWERHGHLLRLRTNRQWKNTCEWHAMKKAKTTSLTWGSKLMVPVKCTIFYYPCIQFENIS